MMYVLRRVEWTFEIIDRNNIGCPVTNFQAVSALRKIKLRTRQAHHPKANYTVRVTIYARVHLNRGIKTREQSKIEKLYKIMDPALGKYHPHQSLQPAVNRQPGYRWENS